MGTKRKGKNRRPLSFMGDPSRGELGPTGGTYPRCLWFRYLCVFVKSREIVSSSTILRLSLLKMLSGSNAIEISDTQEHEIARQSPNKATRMQKCSIGE